VFGPPADLGEQGTRHRYLGNGDWRTLAIAAALERHLQTIPELARPLPDLDALAARPPLRSGAPA
jgi:hypothetical protein